MDCTNVTRVRGSWESRLHVLHVFKRENYTTSADIGVLFRRV